MYTSLVYGCNRRSLHRSATHLPCRCLHNFLHTMHSCLHSSRKPTTFLEYSSHILNIPANNRYYGLGNTSSHCFSDANWSDTWVRLSNAISLHARDSDNFSASFHLTSLTLKSLLVFLSQVLAQPGLCLEWSRNAVVLATTTELDLQTLVKHNMSMS